MTDAVALLQLVISREGDRGGAQALHRTQERAAACQGEFLRPYCRRWQKRRKLAVSSSGAGQEDIAQLLEADGLKEGL